MSNRPRMQKLAWTILFSIFLVLSINGCGTQQSITSKLETSKSKDIEVIMDVRPVLCNDGTFQCNITTNLPTQTSLDVEINTGIYNKTTTSVDNGKATALFKYFKPGPYTLSIKTSDIQPIPVYDVIGYTGGNLKGPYATSIGNNIYGIFYKKDLTFGSKEQIAAAQAPALTEAEKSESRIISSLKWDGTHKLDYDGITYEITRTQMPIDKRAGTGVRYEEVVSKIDFRLPLDKRVRTIISSRVIH